MMSQQNQTRTRVNSPPQDKPLLVYDGGCNSCRRWARLGRFITGEKVDYAPFQQVGTRFPEIPEAAYMQSVQLIDPDGTVYSAAEAVFRALATRRGLGWILWLYRTIPGFAPISEWIYRLIAHNRSRTCTVHH